ncbi:Asx homology domain-containing protein [Trametes polyzona]|nr:Asx homology domain-containing protein [Trametes polyzona]
MDDATSTGSRTTRRRSARTPAKPPPKTPTTASAAATAKGSTPARGKQTAAARATASTKTSAEKLEQLLTNPKSKLTKIDISDVINYTNFLELSEESQNRLCGLLPPTAFSTYVPTVCPSHPDYRPPTDGGAPGDSNVVDRMDVDDADAASGSGSESGATPATLDPTVFTSPFFLSAAHTWQDHLFSSWLTKKATDEMARFAEGARTGDMHVDWKDEVWEAEQQQSSVTLKGKKAAEEIDLTTLAKKELLREGDILVYKRGFPGLKDTIHKDILVESINYLTHTIDVLLAPDQRRTLPQALLVHNANPKHTGEKMLSIKKVTDVVALERGVIDVDGRIRPSDKYAHDVAACTIPPPPGGVTEEMQNMIEVRAWKSFTVWRWREEMRDQTELQGVQDRGGRERIATLFYLRGCLNAS